MTPVPNPGERLEATADGGPAQYRRLKASVTGGFSTSISATQAGPAGAIGSGRAADEVCTIGSYESAMGAWKRRNLKLLPTTSRLETLMAAAASMGLSSRCSKG